MKRITIDGNTAAAYVSYAFSELAVIYPITPSSPMAELADKWSAEGKPNLFGDVPKVIQMQSESGVAGALHGALSCGALATTYTCSQGLLLMLPNMYKIAGELLPTVFHVSSRAIATHALNIFGDHQDVMACRQTGFAMLASSSVQEALDLALVAHLTTLKTSIPFLHFFDGFRTSHEQATVENIEYEEMKALLDEEDIQTFKNRALSPKKPIQRGTAQNGDVYFQNREASSPHYARVADEVQKAMDTVAKITKRSYHVFDYCGKEDAENVVVMMGSGANTMVKTIKKYNANGGKAGVITVRLYRPFDGERFCSTLPKTCKRIAVLERTKEAGCLGEPLYLDICATLAEQGRSHIQTLGGRYGLGGKEFSPDMAYAVLQNLSSQIPKNHFTVGIIDDCAHSSLDFSTPYPLFTETTDCIFYGLGSDGTVGANKNTVKILGEHTNLWMQAYFCYDSKKSGSATISHLRFGKKRFQAPYLIDRADFVACHAPSYLTRYDMLSKLKEHGVFLLNCPWGNLDELEQHLPSTIKRELAKKRIRFFVIDGTKIADEVGLKGRTGTIMQAAFFLVNAYLLPFYEAISHLKEQIKELFSRKGEEVVEKNFKALDRVENAVKEIEYPLSWENVEEKTSSPSNNEYFEVFMKPILSLQGDKLPVSAFQADGSVPTGTAKLETHGIAQELPKWIPENCIQCNLCAISCPHATIRPILFSENEETPSEFTANLAYGVKNSRFRIQVLAKNCMGCGVCAEVCPAKEKALVMRPALETYQAQATLWEFAQTLKQIFPTSFPRNSVKGSQFYPPLFEFSYACAGCGETAYIKLLTQLFGERMVIANATGCSSIYGASAPSCPYTKNSDGHGPAWANSLFEDNAEFGYGMRLALDTQGIKNTSVWIIGGDGWAYDIGFGGLDHVLASGKNVNVLVLDSEVYSNTGGQSSKATPMGAVARFASAGKRNAKKDLGLMMMSYGNVYIAQVSMGANQKQLVTALTEAEAYDGPSLIIAYSPCIAHGVSLRQCAEEERLAVACGYWPLYRFNPILAEEGKNPFQLDSAPPTVAFRDFLLRENRFTALKKSAPEEADELFKQAEFTAKKRLQLYQKLAEISLN